MMLKNTSKRQKKMEQLFSDLEEGGPGLRYRAEDLEGQRWMFIQKKF